MYFIYCNLKNDYIGSFVVNNNTFTAAGNTEGQSLFVSNPQTVITGLQSQTNNVSFQIHAFLNGALVPQTLLDGFANVQIDFLKFRPRR